MMKLLTSRRTQILQILPTMVEISNNYFAQGVAVAAERTGPLLTGGHEFDRLGCFGYDVPNPRGGRV